jgi:hypothetical protein
MVIEETMWREVSPGVFLVDSSHAPLFHLTIRADLTPFTSWSVKKMNKMDLIGKINHIF